MGVAFPASGVMHGKPNPGLVQLHLLHQMNGGPDGKITKSVHCLHAGGQQFTCRLQSTRSTALGAKVVVTGDSLQTVWQPING
jgi:hypothetical protein